MSNWLGFSLTPHLRVDDEEEAFGRDENPSQDENAQEGCFQTPISIMPLRSDGSLCALEPYRRSNGTDGLHYPIFCNIFLLFLWFLSTEMNLDTYYIFFFLRVEYGDSKP